MDPRVTIAHYDRIAGDYARLISPLPPPDRAEALGRLAARLAPGAHVLEIGSGTGRDAAHLERLGLAVRRTDAAPAFAAMQEAHGHRVTVLDVTADDLGGPWDAILCLCVLMHVDRARLPAVLLRLATALMPGGTALLSIREGQGGTGGPAPMTFWTAPAFATALRGAGFAVLWEARHVDSDEDAWITVLVEAGRDATCGGSCRGRRTA